MLPFLSLCPIYYGVYIDKLIFISCLCHQITRALFLSSFFFFRATLETFLYSVQLSFKS